MLVVHPASTCDVCLDGYTADSENVPHSITCGHVFCLRCVSCAVIPVVQYTYSFAAAFVTCEAVLALCAVCLSRNLTFEGCTSIGMTFLSIHLEYRYLRRTHVHSSCALIPWVYTKLRQRNGCSKASQT